MLDDEFLTPHQATALAGALATAAAAATPDDVTIVRTMDLPAGTEYVLFDDVSMVALSSRLDETRRSMVLSELGLT